MKLFAIQKMIAALTYAIALCGVIPLFQYLDLFPKVVFIAAFCLGIRWDISGLHPLKPWLLNGAATVSLLWYAGRFSRANPAQPVVSALVILLSIRLVTEKSPRYYQQIYAIALFCLASSSLFDLSPIFLVWLTAMLLMVALALVLVTFHSQDRRMTLSASRLRTVVAFGLALPLVSLPLLVAYFPILPRTQLPLWNFLNPPAAARSGLSEKVAPGSSATLGEGKSLAFRAETAKLATPQPYWRGVVFNRVEGNIWSREADPPAEADKLPMGEVRQTIFLEPNVTRFLIGLDLPLKLAPFRGRRYPDHTFELNAPPPRRTSYEVRSILTDTTPVTGNIDRNYYLRLPSGLSGRILELSGRIRATGKGDAERIEALSAWYRNGSFTYARSGLPTGRDSLEQFLFDRRTGHCEFFASSFAIVLRAAGVPARLVGGYLGGDYNELGGYYLVTDDMAHVWVEAFVAGEGWRRIDPSSMARNAGAIWGGKRARTLGQQLRLSLDAFNYYWNRGVIAYDFERQVEIVRGANLRLKRLDAGRIWKRLLPAGIVISTAVALYLMMRGGWFKRRSPEERLLLRFVARLNRDRGESIEPSREGLLTIARRTEDRRVNEFVAIYAGAIYRDRQLSAEERRRLNEIVRQGFG